MGYTKKEYKLGTEISKQISNIQESMTMNEQLNERNATSNKPCCPYCGSDNIDTVSDVSSGKYVHVAYFCNNCDRYFLYPQFKDLSPKIKAYTNIEDRDKAKSNEDNLSCMPSIINELMAEKGFTTVNQALDFLAKHYSETKDFTKPKKHRTSPGKMTIKDAEKYIKINKYPKSPCGFLDTFVNVTITYVKAFTDDIESIDTVSFTCDDIVSLQFLWTEFADKNGLYEDCISAFSIDLTEADKRYVDSINKFITEVLLKRILAWDYRTNPPSDKERDEIIKNILDSSYFSNFKSKIIYPHTDTVRDPDTGRKVQTVKRYWGEE